MNSDSLLRLIGDLSANVYALQAENVDLKEQLAAAKSAPKPPQQ